jgi:hypothetical protein
MFFTTARDDDFVAEFVQRFGEATTNTRAPPVMKMVLSVSFMEVSSIKLD